MSCRVDVVRKVEFLKVGTNNTKRSRWSSLPPWMKPTSSSRLGTQNVTIKYHPPIHHLREIGKSDLVSQSILVANRFWLQCSPPAPPSRHTLVGCVFGASPLLPQPSILHRKKHANTPTPSNSFTESIVCPS